MPTREQRFANAVALWEAGRAVEALEALAQVGQEATDAQDWPVALHAHRLTAEIWFHLGDIGRALSHAAEGVYLSLEHEPRETLASLGQLLAFVELAVAQGFYAVATEVGVGMSRALKRVQPHPEAEGWWHLAQDVARLFQLVGEAAGRQEHPAFAEAAALAALVDQATEGRLRLNAWVHSTVGVS